jgi:predicted amidophosphoribosyltransferase
MSGELHEIGRCKGCDKAAELEDGICRACLHDPKRGRKWSMISHRCRTDPAFAWKVLSMVKTAGGRRLFLSTYGAVFRPVPDAAAR